KPNRIGENSPCLRFEFGRASVPRAAPFRWIIKFRKDAARGALALPVVARHHTTFSTFVAYEPMVKRTGGKHASPLTEIELIIPFAVALRLFHRHPLKRNRAQEHSHQSKGYERYGTP